jgi:hypothetical protein
MTAVPANAVEEFELQTQFLERAQVHVQANLQARKRLVQGFEALATAVESELEQGGFPIASIAELEELENKIQGIDQALTSTLKQVAEEIYGMLEPI